MAITLKDVASVAGVSTATVSRALAGSERVAPQTATHIRNIADELGYRFDNVARALRQKRSNLVGMVAPDYAFPYAQELIYALNRELFRAELVLASVASFGSVENEFVQVERLLGQRMDALIFMPADPVNSEAAIDITREEDIPVIQLFRRVQHAQTADVILDYVSGLEFALRCIRPDAIRSIAYINDDLALADQGKLAAWQHLAERFPRDDRSKITLVRPGPTQQASYEIALAKLNCDPLPDLIIVSSSEALPFVVDHIDKHASADARPLVLCLDAISADFASAKASIVSLEFSMSSTARAIAERVHSALSNEGARRETVRIQPFLNLSRI